MPFWPVCLLILAGVVFLLVDLASRESLRQEFSRRHQELLDRFQLGLAERFSSPPGLRAKRRPVRHIDPPARFGVFHPATGRLRLEGESTAASREQERLEVHRAILLIRNSHQDSVLTDRIILVAREIRPGVLAVAWQHRGWVLPAPEAEQARLRRGLVGLALPIVLLALAFAWVGPWRRVSLRAEVLFLFCCASGLPLVAIFHQGRAFVEYRRLGMVHQQLDRLEVKARAFDRLTAQVRHPPAHGHEAPEPSPTRFLPGGHSRQIGETLVVALARSRIDGEDRAARKGLLPLARAGLSRLNRQPTYPWQGRFWQAVSLPGEASPDKIFLALSPDAQVEASLGRLRGALAVGFGLTLALTLLVAQALARHLGQPLGTLTLAIQAVARRQFTHRLPVTTDDELGALAGRFNQTLAGLEELEHARIIQRALFPEQVHNIGAYRIIGYSASMQQLGGDFFDLVSPQSGHGRLIIGDVAGHGVPAALVMAMAKAVFQTAVREGTIARPETATSPRANRSDVTSVGTPAEVVLEQLNMVLAHVRGRGLPAMMALLLLEIDPTPGSPLVCWHAGHTFPLRIPKAGPVRYVEMRGRPLGPGRRPRLDRQEVGLEDGERLLIYSDGIVEAMNPAGEPFGFARLEALAMELRTLAPQLFITTFYRRWRSCASTLTDDITLVLIEPTLRTKIPGNAPQDSKPDQRQPPPETAAAGGEP
jgi:serine phosphatase RsbU (regulator of sigma subunit)/HAMP domain-containing protein